MIPQTRVVQTIKYCSILATVIIFIVIEHIRNNLLQTLKLSLILFFGLHFILAFLRNTNMFTGMGIIGPDREKRLRVLGLCAGIFIYSCGIYMMIYGKNI